MQKETDRFQTMTSFRPKKNEFNKLTIKVTEGNDDLGKNHAYTCSERLMKKDKEILNKKYFNTNTFITTTQNNHFLTMKNISDSLIKKKKEYTVPKVITKRKQEPLTEEYNKNNRMRNEKREQRIHCEDYNDSHRKKKIIEELMIRNEKTAIIDLQEHLINETNNKQFKTIEKKMNKLKENDISIGLNIEDIENEKIKSQSNNERLINKTDNDNNNGEIIKTKGLDTQLDKSKSQHSSIFNKVYYVNNHLLKSTNTKRYSKSQKEIQSKPRVDVNEYLMEISKYNTHHKSHSSLINNHNKLTSYQDTNSNNVITSPNIINKNKNDKYKEVNFRHSKSKSLHLKRVVNNQNCHNDKALIKGNNNEIYEDDDINYQSNKRKLVISPEQFDQLLIQRIEQKKQKTSDHNKDIAKYAELLKLQGEINTLRDREREKEKRKPRLIRNEYYIGKRTLETQRSASQSTILEPNEYYYTCIIPTKELLGVELKETHNKSLSSISKGDYDEFINEKEDQIKKGNIGNSSKDKIKRDQLIKLLNKLLKCNSKNEDKKQKDNQSINNKSDSDLISSKLNPELLEKVQNTLGKADQLFLNKSIYELLNETNQNQKELRDNKEIAIKMKEEEKITEEEEGDLLIQTSENNKEPLLTLPNMTNDYNNNGSKEDNSEETVYHNNSNSNHNNSHSPKLNSNGYILVTPKKKKSDSINIKTISESQINDSDNKETSQQNKEEKGQLTLDNVEIIKQPSISEEIISTNSLEVNYPNKSPKELGILTLTSKDAEEKGKIKINEKQQLTEAELKTYQEKIPNLSEWYIFFIKRNILINIAKYANTRSLTKSKIEMMIILIKRTIFNQINTSYKYQLYLMKIRSCFIYYFKNAFRQIMNYRNRTKAFVDKMSILYKFLSLERIQFFGDIREHINNLIKDEVENDNDYDYDYDYNKDDGYSNNNAREDKLINSLKYKNKSSISNEVIPEINNSNIMESTIYYHEEYLNEFIFAINNVFVLPTICRGLQAIYDYAFSDELDNNQDSNVINKESITNSLTGDILNLKLDIDNQLDENSMQHCNTYLYESLEERSNRMIYPNSEDSDCLYRSHKLLKYKREEFSNPSSKNNASFLNDKSQKSIRNIDITLINQSQLSLHAYSQKSNKNVISINDLFKTKPKLKLKMGLDSIKTPLRKNHNGKSQTPKSNKSSIHNDDDNNANRKRSICSISDHDISADKDLGSVIDWDYIISNNKPNGINTPLAIDDNPIKNNTNTNKNCNRVDNDDENEVLAHDAGRSDSNRSDNKMEREMKSVLMEKKTDERSDRNDITEFLEINVEEIEEESWNNINDRQSNNHLSDRNKDNNGIDIKQDTNNIIIEVNDKSNVAILIENKNTENNRKQLKPSETKNVIINDTEMCNLKPNEEMKQSQSIVELDNITNEIIDQITVGIVNDLIQTEVNYHNNQPLFPSKNPLLSFFDNQGYIIPTNFFSVFLRSVAESSKETSLNFFNNRIAPLILRFIKCEIQKNYAPIYNKISIPVKTNPKLLMNSYLLQDEAMRKQSKEIISKENRVFIPKTILNTINKASFAMRKEYSSSISSNDISNDQMLNECLIDAANEIIEKQSIYGEIGSPMPWSIRSRVVSFKYDSNPQSMQKLQETVLDELNKLLSMKMALIPSNHEDLDHEQLAQDRERKYIESIREELMDEDYIWKSLEDEETDVKLSVTKVIMDQLLNEIVEIMEHVQFSRMEPMRYQHKSIYACEDIPRLSFQNTTENDIINSNELEFTN